MHNVSRIRPVLTADRSFCDSSTSKLSVKWISLKSTWVTQTFLYNRYTPTILVKEVYYKKETFILLSLPQNIYKHKSKRNSMIMIKRLFISRVPLRKSWRRERTQSKGGNISKKGKLRDFIKLYNINIFQILIKDFVLRIYLLFKDIAIHSLCCGLKQTQLSSMYMHLFWSFTEPVSVQRIFLWGKIGLKSRQKWSSLES